MKINLRELLRNLDLNKFILPHNTYEILKLLYNFPITFREEILHNLVANKIRQKQGL